MRIPRSSGRVITVSLLGVALWVVATSDRMDRSHVLSGAVSYNCFECNPAKTECSLIPTDSAVGNPCEALGLATSCASACECPSGTWPCDMNACLAAFTDVKNWSSYKPNSTEGYDGSIYVPPYLIFVPRKGAGGPHGVVWFYNTQALIDAQSSWTVIDPSSKGLGTAARGFAKGATDGRYAYFAPNKNNTGPSGSVMRWDSQKSPSLVDSYELFNPSAASLTAQVAQANGPFAAAVGFNGAVFDGSYVYFVPDVNYQGAHNDVLRYDVSRPFKDIGSWQVFNPKPANTPKKGYAGGIYDGRYVYFIPKGDDDNRAFMHGEVMRYDTRAPFDSASSWTMFDPSSNGMTQAARGYNGGVSDGKYLYLAPFLNANGPHGDVLRYDLSKPFDQISSWTTIDVAAKVEPKAKGYIGAAFDGQFVYFSPYSTDENLNSNVLRYNTKEPFEDASSWTVFEAGLAETGAAGVSAPGASKSSMPSVSGVSFTATAANGTKDANGVLDLSAPSKVTFDWECPGSNFTDPNSGFDPTPVQCSFRDGKTTMSNLKQYGSESYVDVDVTRSGTYGIECSFDRVNGETRVKVTLCSRAIAVNVAGTSAESVEPKEFSVKGDNGAVPDANGVITVPKGSKIVMDWDCKGDYSGLNSYAFEEVFQAPICDVTLGDTSSRYSVDGAGSIYTMTANQNQSLKLNCFWTYGRPGFSNKRVELCSKNLSIKVTE